MHLRRCAQVNSLSEPSASQCRHTGAPSRAHLEAVHFTQLRVRSAHDILALHTTSVRLRVHFNLRRIHEMVPVTPVCLNCFGQELCSALPSLATTLQEALDYTIKNAKDDPM